MTCKIRSLKRKQNTVCITLEKAYACNLGEMKLKMPVCHKHIEDGTNRIISRQDIAFNLVISLQWYRPRSLLNLGKDADDDAVWEGFDALARDFTNVR